MSYLQIELARTMDEDRSREAEHCRRINEALAMRNKELTNPGQTLMRLALSLMKWGHSAAAEPAR